MRTNEWKPIKDFDGYFINIQGQVKSTRNCRGKKEIILKCCENTSGYKTVNLYKNNKCYTKTLHRLIMKTFKKNPNNYPCINHKDGNKFNNNIGNLEWCSYSHNNKEAYKLGLKDFRVKEKKVKQLTRDNNVIKSWKSLNEIYRQLGYSKGNICQVCNSKRKSAYGYIWKYIEE